VTIAGTIMGTLGYMAPEQARHDQVVDARADVFSLGCVLFECITGTPAFAADHPMALLTKLVFAKPPRLSDVLPTAPANLDALLWCMLAKDPAERPQHGGTLAAALIALGSHVATGTPAQPFTALTLDEQRMISVVMVGGENMRAGNTEPTLSEALAGSTLLMGETERSLEHRARTSTNQPTRNEGQASSVQAAHGEAQRVQMEQALRQGAASWGGRLAQLRDGSVVVAIGGTELVTDQAAQAARCALWLRTRARRATHGAGDRARRPDGPNARRRDHRSSGRDAVVGRGG